MPWWSGLSKGAISIDGPPPAKHPPVPMPALAWAASMAAAVNTAQVHPPSLRQPRNSFQDETFSSQSNAGKQAAI